MPTQAYCVCCVCMWDPGIVRGDSPHPGPLPKGAREKGCTELSFTPVDRGEKTAWNSPLPHANRGRKDRAEQSPLSIRTGGEKTARNSPLPHANRRRKDHAEQSPLPYGERVRVRGLSKDYCTNFFVISSRVRTSSGRVSPLVLSIIEL